jgi:hypothetical protein
MPRTPQFSVLLKNRAFFGQFVHFLVSLQKSVPFFVSLYDLVGRKSPVNSSAESGPTISVAMKKAHARF